MLVGIENGCDCVGVVLKKRSMTSANERIGRTTEDGSARYSYIIIVQ